MYVFKGDDLWKHTMMRIKNAEKKAKDEAQFDNLMVTRLMRIKDERKLHYAITALEDLGYHHLAEIYRSKFLINALTKEP